MTKRAAVDLLSGSGQMHAAILEQASSSTGKQATNSRARGYAATRRLPFAAAAGGQASRALQPNVQGDSRHDESVTRFRSSVSCPVMQGREKKQEKEDAGQAFSSPAVSESTRSPQGWRRSPHARLAPCAPYGARCLRLSRPSTRRDMKISLIPSRQALDGHSCFPRKVSRWTPLGSTRRATADTTSLQPRRRGSCSLQSILCARPPNGHC